MGENRTRRNTKDLLLDSCVGMGWGAGTGLILVLWVLLLDTASGGDIRRDPGFDFIGLNAVYVLGLGAGGGLAGLLKPWLGRLFGQVLVAFCLTFALYGGVAFVSAETITGNPVKDGLVMACFATPIWLAVAYWKGWHIELAGWAKDRRARERSR